MLQMKQFALFVGALVVRLQAFGCLCMQVVYKKLLNGTPTFADLEDAQPALAKGLKAMLEYDGDDFQDVFSQMFEVEFRVFDSVCL
jgi:hypothetical protein